MVLSQLTDAERYEIIEFLKTFNQDGDYQFTRPAGAQLPANVRMNVGLPRRPPTDEEAAEIDWTAA